MVPVSPVVLGSTIMQGLVLRARLELSRKPGLFEQGGQRREWGNIEVALLSPWEP